MALELNQLVQVDLTGQNLWATDKTGEYVLDTNDGGWGSPNKELAQSALGVIAVARDEFRSIFTPVSPTWKYNGSATNDTENVFQIAYGMDSIIDVYMIRLMVSNDNVVSVDGVTFVEGHFWYSASDQSVYQLKDAVPVLVENLLELIDALPELAVDGNTPHIVCTDAYVVKLAIEYGRQYKDYVVKRREGCDDIKAELFNMLNFKEDIIGARRSFTSGLFSQSQSIIETLNAEQNIV